MPGNEPTKYTVKNGTRLLFHYVALLLFWTKKYIFKLHTNFKSVKLVHHGFDT